MDIDDDENNEGGNYEKSFIELVNMKLKEKFDLD